MPNEDIDRWPAWTDRERWEPEDDDRDDQERLDCDTPEDDDFDPDEDPTEGEYDTYASEDDIPF